jgi:RND family efflux transporter MFP subunit
MTIEEGVALTGDLHPLETIDVRSRIEGDLMAVYVREGDQVGAGQLLARFEASEQESSRASAEADRVAANAELTNAQWTLEQNQSLFKAGAIAERDLKNSQQAVAAAQARLAAAVARLRASGNQARDTRVVAPASGVVEKRLVDGGVHLARGAPMFTIVRSGTLELAAAVPARQATPVRPGQTVHFVADARRFDGKVARVSPTIDPATRAVTVYVQVPNPGNTLRGGTFATGRVVSQYLSGTQTWRIGELVDQYPDSKVELHPRLATAHNINEGDWVTVTTRRSEITVQAMVVKTIRPDTVFIPYHWPGDRSANRLTHRTLDPHSKIPEYKVSACRLEKAPGPPQWARERSPELRQGVRS